MPIARSISCLLAASALAAAALPVAAQNQLSGGPRGLTDSGTRRTTTSALTGTDPSQATAPLAMPQVPGLPPGALPTPGVASPLPPLPLDPSLSPVPVMFGQQMFSGRFANQGFSGFNPEYQIAVGDRVTVRMWGGFSYEATQAVDAQGNLFIPNVGPISVLGVRNADLNAQVESQIKRTFRASVGVYATLEAAQPVKVYVTGFVRAPGLYGGLSSDSVLYYLDRAGGIDPARGSFLEVDVLRGGKPRAKVNLYSFLLDGRIEPMQLQDGDTVVVTPRRHTVQVTGEALNPYVFEFSRPAVSGAELLALARPRPSATHMSVVRKIGAELRSEYHPLSEAASVTIQDGDEVTITSDKYPGTILVRIEGANLGERSLVMPYGSRLKDAIARLKPAPQANVEALQLFRKSVALRQKELLDGSLRSLETYALTGRSATSEEAALRQKEGDQILQFIDRARNIQPRGQVVIGQSAGAGETLLEDGDVLRIPERSNVVLVSGEVMVPNALVYDTEADAETYVRRAGGYTQAADDARVLVVRQDGSIADATRVGDKPAATELRPGDEILVLPKVQSKNVEVARGITQIVYQIAVAARIALGL
ncbi:polysaccharide biosynthesis/export family protein [Rubrivivax gelatinosus]|uniref:Protein involved in polysaccharide export with SLBB domain n=1 Tax=Rubrivivax gelatinosus TaxID=28068 RepID=A0A4V2SGU6_RUBGE|nr:polysaccharide biosynthesis/export family protein [Rubrivivax gelatinosus]MBK1688175.1 polysialic acid transporter [Rubrivivax gelatinosus]TCP02538.1 protein involved in polysaccharide export with SLBB domain [Rubrivivax gelatinosus]